MSGNGSSHAMAMPMPIMGGYSMLSCDLERDREVADCERLRDGVESLLRLLKDGFALNGLYCFGLPLQPYL